MHVLFIDLSQFYETQLDETMQVCVYNGVWLKQSRIKAREQTQLQ